MKQPFKSYNLYFVLPLFLLAATQVVQAHGISDADKAAMLEGGYARYIGLGASHMLTGYDHLLFLFGVMFFLTKFKDIAKFITAFTLGHCITLIGATFMGISMNYFIIDALIALTVIYKGFDNLDGFQKCLNMKSPNLLKLVFVFGLIHGFGLSTRLQQLPLGDDGFRLLMRILSFNVGVEVGQIAALSVMLVVLAGWRKSTSFARFSGVANVGLVIGSTLLFLMQMHGFEHTIKAEDFSPSKETEQAAGLEVDKQEDWTDAVTITIPPGKGKEYKFHLIKGDVIEFSWTTDGGALFYDFHGDPKGAAANDFESFEKSTEKEASGSLTAPFEGAIGWSWGNKGSKDVEITLKTRGSYKVIGLR